MIANDDPGGDPYATQIGIFAAGNSWGALDSNNQTVSVQAFKADGSPGSIATANVGGALQYGVAGSPRTGPDAVPIDKQLEHDPVTGQSEALVLTFSGNLDRASFGVSNLYRTEAGVEQGKWIAYFDGQEVASGTFTLPSNSDSRHVGTFDIDTGGLAFNSVRFEALPYVNPNAPGALTGDSSDYFLTGFEGTGSAEINAEYLTTEDAPLIITTADRDLLENDSDPEGHGFAVSHVNGSAIVNGQMVVLSSGATLKIGTDGSFVYNPNGAFDHLVTGELATDTFEYTVTDQYGATDTATATISIIGKSGPIVLPHGSPSPSFVDVETVVPPEPEEAEKAGQTVTEDAPEAIPVSLGDIIDLGEGAYRLMLDADLLGAQDQNQPATIRNFDLGGVEEGGDVLDLRDLLPDSVTEDSLGDFLKFESAGQDVQVKVDLDGNGPGDAVHIATLEGLGDTADLLQTLLNNGQIDFDKG